jgi:hypothetical protein
MQSRIAAANTANDAANSFSQSPAPILCSGLSPIIGARPRLRNNYRGVLPPSDLSTASLETDIGWFALPAGASGGAECAAITGPGQTKKHEKAAQNWRGFHSFPKMNSWYSLLYFLVVVRFPHPVEAGDRGCGQKIAARPIVDDSGSPGLNVSSYHGSAAGESSLDS